MTTNEDMQLFTTSLLEHIWLLESRIDELEDRLEWTVKYFMKTKATSRGNRDEA